MIYKESRETKEEYITRCVKLVRETENKSRNESIKVCSDYWRRAYDAYKPLLDKFIYNSF